MTKDSKNERKESGINKSSEKNRRSRGDHAKVFFFEILECTNLFCFLKSQKMRIQRRGLNNREHKQRFFDHKRRYCVPILFKEKRVFLCVEKVDNGKEKYSENG